MHFQVADAHKEQKILVGLPSDEVVRICPEAGCFHGVLFHCFVCWNLCSLPTKRTVEYLSLGPCFGLVVLIWAAMGSQTLPTHTARLKSTCSEANSNICPGSFLERSTRTRTRIWETRLLGCT